MEQEDITKTLPVHMITKDIKFGNTTEAAYVFIPENLDEDRKSVV